jgi:peptidoglycan hydrolase-like protein with peptidoglycan-binding domain
MKRSLHNRSTIAATTALAAVLAVGGLTPALAGDSGMQHRQGAQSQQLQNGAQNPNQQHVRAVQQKLIQEGYDVGSADGQWGPKTSSALRKFQQDEGIQASGQIDQQTLQKLGVASNTPARPDGAMGPSGDQG